MTDLTPEEAIRKYFPDVVAVEVVREFAHRLGNYRISFKSGEVTKWVIQFDQDNGEVIRARQV